MKVRSFVGGHPVNIVGGATFDPTIRKYRGGDIIATVAPSGQMLNARLNVITGDDLTLDGVSIPTTFQEVVDADPIPTLDDGDFAIVSALYLTACKALGWDTSHLLTMGPAVIDDVGHIVGTVGLVRN